MKKIKQMLVHRTFRRFFLTYLALFLALTSAATAVVFTVTQNERTKKTRLSCEDNIGRLAASVSRELGGVHQISSMLKSFAWMRKLTAADGAFDDEFNALRRREISDELISLSAGYSVVKEIAVLYPRRKLVVAPSGWWVLDEYVLRLARVYEAATDAVSAAVFPQGGPEGGVLFSQNFCFQNRQILLFVQPLESVGAPRALALIVLDKAHLRAACSRYFSDKLTFFELTDARLGPLFNWERPAEGGESIVLQRPCDTLLATVTARYSVPLFEIGGGELTLLLLLEALLCFAALGISWWAASRNYRPMGRLLANLQLNSGNGTRGDDYKAIETSFQFLHAENRATQKRAELYREAARQSALIHLLKGYFDVPGALEELRRCHISCAKEAWYAVVLLALEESAPASRAKNRVRALAACDCVLREQNLNGNAADTMDGCIAVILQWDSCLARESAPREYAAQIAEYLADLSVDTTASGIYQGLIGISAAYQEVTVPRVSALCGGSSGLLGSGRIYYYPTDWEMQFIESLKSGNSNVALSILEQIEAENQTRNLPAEVEGRLIALLQETVRRVAFEAELSTKPDVSNANFEGIARQASQICAAVSARDKRALQDVKSGILDYVNRNYACSELTLKSLGGQYNISPPSVSRIFKEVTGTNFYEYITALRMKKARELLALGAKNVYTQVGYDSDYSFKRAFLRVVGMKPGEYVAKTRKK